MFKFSGTCKYVLAASEGSFRVLVQNAAKIPRRRRQLAYTQAVEIEVGNTVIRLEADNVVTVCGAGVRAYVRAYVCFTFWVCERMNIHL